MNGLLSLPLLLTEKEEAIKSQKESHVSNRKDQLKRGGNGGIVEKGKKK